MTRSVKLVAAAGLGCLAIGIGLWQVPAIPTAEAQQPKVAPPPVGAPVAKEKSDNSPDLPSAIKVQVSGRVVDPDGKPVPGAKVIYQQEPLREDSPNLYPDPSTGETDKDGKYQFQATMYDKGPDGHEPLGRITAIAPGFAAAGTGAGLPKSLVDRTLKFARDDVPLENRFVDLEGRPIAGVTVRAAYVIVSPNNDLEPWLKDLKEGKLQGGATTPGVPIPAGQLAITATSTSDKEGRIKLNGIGRGRVAFVRIDGPTIESELVWIMTHDHDTVAVPQPPNSFSLFADQPVHGCKSDIVAAPCIPVEGVVKDLDTGKPISGATVYNALNSPYGMGRHIVETKTDGQGRYRLVGRPNRTGYRVTVTPPKGEPYILTADYPPRVEPGKTATLNFNVKRGVFITGKVTDQATGRPMRAAIEYKTWGDNPQLKGMHPIWWIRTTSAPDGTYELVGLPGRGLVHAKLDEHRRPQYLTGAGEEKIKGRAREGQSLVTVPERTFPDLINSIVELDAKADGQNVADIPIVTGKTVKGRLEDPDGKPLSKVTIQGVAGIGVHLPLLPKPEFMLNSINPQAPKPYFFFEREKNLAAAVIIKGDEPEGFTVRLQHAAAVTGRLIGDNGEPLADTEIFGGIDNNQLGLKAGWYGFFVGRTDKEGRFKISGLLPGAKLSARVRQNHELGAQIFEGQPFSAGEERDFGDIKLKPAKE